MSARCTLRVADLPSCILRAASRNLSHASRRSLDARRWMRERARGSLRCAFAVCHSTRQASNTTDRRSAGSCPGPCSAGPAESACRGRDCAQTAYLGWKDPMLELPARVLWHAGAHVVGEQPPSSATISDVRSTERRFHSPTESWCPCTHWRPASASCRPPEPPAPPVPSGWACTSVSPWPPPSRLPSLP